MIKAIGIIVLRFPPISLSQPKVRGHLSFHRILFPSASLRRTLRPRSNRCPGTPRKRGGLDGATPPRKEEGSRLSSHRQNSVALQDSFAPEASRIAHSLIGAEIARTPLPPWAPCSNGRPEESRGGGGGGKESHLLFHHLSKIIWP